MKIKQAKEIILTDSYGSELILTRQGISGSLYWKRIINKIGVEVSSHPDYLINLSNRIIKHFPRFSISSTTYTEQEYPDNTIF